MTLKMTSDGVDDPTSDQAMSTSRPDQSFLRDLGRADPRVFARAWLALQVQRLGRIDEAILLLRAGSAGLDLAATLPADQPVSEGLQRATEAALARGSGVARSQSGQLEVGYPFTFKGEVIGVVAIALPDSEDAEATLRALRWGAGWLRAWSAERAGEAAAPNLERARGAFELLNGALEESSFQAAARRVATELAQLTGCDRVSVGFRQRGQSRVAAISHSAHFGHRMTLIRLLAGAMDEAIDQQASILYPVPDGAPPYGDRAHQQLAREVGGGQILTVPVLSGNHFLGAFIFERPVDQPLDQQDTDFIDSLAAFAGPILEERRRNDRWLVTKAAESLSNAFEHIVGPGHLRGKLVLVSVILLVLMAWLAQGVYRVTGDATLEGETQRSLIAPFEGFIADAIHTAGDTVDAGAIVARLDDRELSLERLNRVAERQRYLLEYEEALGTRDRASSSIARAQIDQAEAQVELLEKQLQRTEIRAPFSGLLVSGDLSQSIGAAVTRGETLFEIAPMDNYRVILWVSDTQIGNVFPDQKGSLLLAALPGQLLPVSVTQITPVTEVRDGQNVFKVTAGIDTSLAQVSESLRPGMQGIVKLDVGERRLVWIWTRSFVAWWRLTAWRWSG